MYVCVCVCVYVCMYVCMCVCMYVCVHVCVYVFMYVCMLCWHVVHDFPLHIAHNTGQASLAVKLQHITVSAKGMYNLLPCKIES